MAFTLYNGQASWDRAGKRSATWLATKYYAFNGQRIAMRDESGLYYLHADRLGSTMAVTNESGNTVDDHGYYAYGRDRRGSELRTAQRFTGQQGDASGLIYMNARYYDRSAELTSKPQIGQFISPDTLVPDATNVFDYNRYMYARGNSMQYNDPDGHCATLSSSAPDENDGECWRYANTILAQWDNTPDYWNERFYSKDNFLKNVASNAENHANAFHNAFMQYLGSDAYKAWNAKQPRPSVSNAAAADPTCAGQAACQALVQHANQVVDPVVAYCQTHDCPGVTSDVVGAVSAAGVAIACIPGFAVCGTASLIGTAVGFGTGTFSVVHTGTLLLQGNNKVTKADLVVSVVTFVGGSVFPVAAKLEPRPSAIVGFGVSGAQLIWDGLGSEWWNSRK